MYMCCYMYMYSDMYSYKQLSYYTLQLSQVHLLRAPMPGVVKSITCEEGDEVYAPVYMYYMLHVHAHFISHILSTVTVICFIV